MTKSKELVVVDHHHEVLPHWVRKSNELASRLPLITIDSHTDLHDAFLRYAWKSVSGREEELPAAVADRMSKVDRTSADSLELAVRHLRHDEHIDCAMQLGAIGPVFVFLSYAPPGRERDQVQIFSFDPCVPGCRKRPHDDDCSVLAANAVIETEILAPRLDQIELIIGRLTDVPYILDIDIDAFSTRQALTPKNRSAFDRLVANACLTTVAREIECFEDLRLEESFLFDDAQRSLLAIL